MANADAWFMCRVGYVETYRALGLVAGERVARRFRDEWPAFGSIEVGAALADDAARLALDTGLRSLDALHLAAALLLPGEDVTFAAWDDRLRAAAGSRGLAVVTAD